MGVTVACGQGALRLAQLQRAGGKRQSAAQFVHGRGWSPGMRLDVAGS
jgi:methionyl-tRNA formyltransferase